MTDKYTILEICRCLVESGLRMIFCTLVINILSSPVFIFRAAYSFRLYPWILILWIFWTPFAYIFHDRDTRGMQIVRFSWSLVEESTVLLSPRVSVSVHYRN